MNALKAFLKEESVKKVFAIALLLALLFSLKSMLNLFLLTFMFGYIFYSLQSFIYNKLHKFVPIKRGAITVAIYGILTLGIGFLIYRYVPMLVKQLIGVAKQVSSFQLDSLSGKLNPHVYAMIKQIKFDQYLQQGGNGLMQTVTHVGAFSLEIFLALILSFFFLMEKEEIIKFGKKFEQSKVSFLYQQYKYYGKNFLNSFGKVLHVQILIALINSVLSIIGLSVMGFSNVLGLGFMIFILGLIPVAGVIVSFVPLSIIAFQIGGVMKILAVVVMIIVIHALESYVLNPKLMSMNTKLPVFFTFITLLISEHFLGIWGLLVGIPLMMFFMDIIHIKEFPSSSTKEGSISNGINIEK
ncbi:AI-2E family transporter (plasmid) [Aneurinibacillus sp. Ricciae_BoGa-3]|uniref:AI-2E family transporter n=1 Tax=Aneurinibacillus sp. Ricciae_BoGa-3 TaxID=3022697 RepID=UPI0023412FF8|nr:AI-2E family transporter [Aneurinibacillus sp. Ricciae_BoGa-3]WCK57194.1 AI-2E family transporter [Aneurinibacillus sp. Ricciae_BoGa-3]